MGNNCCKADNQDNGQELESMKKNYDTDGYDTSKNNRVDTLDNYENPDRQNNLSSKNFPSSSGNHHLPCLFLARIIYFTGRSISARIIQREIIVTE